MNIALIGYGRMGKEIESIARERGHQVPLIVDVDNMEDLTRENLSHVDAVIEFTVPESAVSNIKSCLSAHVPVVVGTTGWLNHFDEVKALCEQEEGRLFFTPNYSLGVNIFFKLNTYLASIMNRFADYDVDMVEVHHTQKLDAPSGTAVYLAEDLLKTLERKERWVLDTPGEEGALNITAVRRDSVPGIHTIHYDSPVDEIEITHSAKSRKGFALGAVLAAEFIAKQTPGIYDMNQLLNIS